MRNGETMIAPTLVPPSLPRHGHLIIIEYSRRQLFVKEKGTGTKMENPLMNIAFKSLEFRTDVIAPSEVD